MADKDLISRKALLEAYDRAYEGEPGKARKLIENAPAVDAVEVVRCKDCIYFWTMCKDVGALPDEYCCEGVRIQDEAPAVDAVEVDAEDDCAACRIVYSHERGEGDMSADK